MPDAERSMKGLMTGLGLVATLPCIVLAEPPRRSVVLQVSSYQLGAGGRTESRLVMREDATWERSRHFRHAGREPRPMEIVARGQVRIAKDFLAWKRSVEEFQFRSGESYGDPAPVNDHWIRISPGDGDALLRSIVVRGLPPNINGRSISAQLRVEWRGERVAKVAGLVAEMENLIGRDR